MANIKSQIKRNRQNEKRRVRNRNFRGYARTAVNQARTAFSENASYTKEAVLKAISALDQAAERGVIHKNNAARRKGRLMKKHAAFESKPAPAEETKASKAKKTYFIPSSIAVSKTPSAPRVNRLKRSPIRKSSRPRHFCATASPRRA